MAGGGGLLFFFFDLSLIFKLRNETYCSLCVTEKCRSNFLEIAINKI